jgi:hypothetical protein
MEAHQAGGYMDMWDSRRLRRATTPTIFGRRVLTWLQYQDEAHFIRGSTGEGPRRWRHWHPNNLKTRPV